jgi:hypothetical protein
MGYQGILWHQFQVLKLLLMLSCFCMCLFTICISMVKCWFKSTGFCFLLNCLLSYSQIVRAFLYTGYKVFIREITWKYILWIFSFYFFSLYCIFKGKQCFILMKYNSSVFLVYFSYDVICKESYPKTSSQWIPIRK